jgi:hypothetical protein
MTGSSRLIASSFVLAMPSLISGLLGFLGEIALATGLLDTRAR